jgi:ACR3 family arsenite transporter
MPSVLRKLQDNLIWSIPAAMLAGFLVGLVWDAKPLSALILPLTILMVYPMMVTLNVRALFTHGDTRLQLVTQGLNFLVVPAAAWLMGNLWFSDDPMLRLGLLLASLLPTSGMTISWTGMARGNVPAAIKMTVLGLLLGSLLTPVYIHVLMGASIDIPMTRIFRQIALLVVLPLVLGHATQRLLIGRFGQQAFDQELKNRFPPLSTLGVLGVAFVALALQAGAIVGDPALLLRIVAALAALYAFNFAVSTWVGRTFFTREDAVALIYGTVMRNLSIALAIAMTLFYEEGAGVALMIAMAYILQVQSAAWYLTWQMRIPLPTKPGGHSSR